MRVPVLVGSNADEATVFGHQNVKTIADYQNFLQADSGKNSGDEFAIYPVRSDTDVPAEYLKLQNDQFAYGAWSLAKAMTRAGQRAYLYDFTYTDTGKRASLGAHHGEELFFLGESFPENWEPNPEDAGFGELLRSYWAQFAKTGDPNGSSSPRWPAYGENPIEFLSWAAGSVFAQLTRDSHVSQQ